MSDSKTRAKLQTVIKVTKGVTNPIFAWPLPSNASRKTILVRHICWWFSVIHTSMFCTYWIMDIYKFVKIDIFHAVKLFAELSAGILLLCALLITNNEGARLRVLLDEMESFVKQAVNEELDVFQSYLTRIEWIHKIIMFLCIFGSSVYVLEPFMVPDIVRPLYLEYPFEVHSVWAVTLTYVSEALVISQIGSMVLSDFLWALLLWYAGAKFDMLCKQLRRASTHDDVRNCIRQHQILLEYVERLKIPIRVIATVLLGICTVSILSGGLIIISSQQLAVAAFECDWVGKSPEMMKDLLFFMHRAQDPVVLQLPGITDALTLEFYTGIMKAVFSYLLTLNAMIDT